jgi:hypothetical protein
VQVIAGVERLGEPLRVPRIADRLVEVEDRVELSARADPRR